MRELDDLKFHSTRRHFLSKTSLGIGALGLASLLDSRLLSGETGDAAPADTAAPPPRVPHFVPRAKRVIYLFQSGGPSQLELFDHKPLLRTMNGQELPDSVRMGQRLTGMTAFQRSFPVAGSQFEFARHGKSGMWVSELLPHTARIVDELCVIKSLHTEAINHDPAVTFFQTGSQQAGRPSIGAWLSYGIGSDNSNLPAFIVLLSRAREGDQPLYSWLWGSGFLPSQHQGVQFRGGKDPVLYLTDPDGVSRTTRRRMLDALRSLEAHEHARVMDPEINARVSQYEMAFRMQTAVPDAMDLHDEPDSIVDLYGPDARKPGTFAANCLLARRLAERGVRFIQLFHRGWDQHTHLPAQIAGQCRDTDRASAALVQDLEARGMLKDTLV